MKRQELSASVGPQPGPAVLGQLDYAEAHLTLGKILVSQGKLREAVMCYEWALALKPGYANAHIELGHAYSLQGRLEEAVMHCERAVALEPDDAKAHLILGGALREQGRFDRALCACEAAVRLRPDYAEAHVAWSSLLLTLGKFREGWEELEWRLRLNPRHAAQPLWKGEDLSDQTLLIWAEQGFGDAIQFARYVNMVKSRGGRIFVEVGTPLLKLFRDSFGSDTIVSSAEEPPHFDVQIPLVSLPRAFGTDLTTIPADVPYLRTDPSLVRIWKERLDELEYPKIGIVWAGNPRHHRDRYRSIAFDVFKHAVSVPGVSVFSLQIGEKMNDVHPNPNIRRISELFADFSDTAAAIVNLDLCVTVDTSVAHLAGALGKPIWVLQQFAPDCRWLLHRQDSPWYPSMRLFRQPRPGDWHPVVERVKGDLVRLAEGDRSILMPQRP